MRGLEFVLAVVFGSLGVRSAVYWLRRPLRSHRVGDHALYALYVTGRVGLWFAFAGIFLLFATVGTTDPETGERIASRGQAFVDAAQEYRFLFLVPVGLAAMQFVAGWFLGRGGGARAADPPAPHVDR
jgi:hypothetical protein